MKFYLSIILLVTISTFAFGQTVEIQATSHEPLIEIPSKKGVDIGVETFIEPKPNKQGVVQNSAEMCAEKTFTEPLTKNYTILFLNPPITVDTNAPIFTTEIARTTNQSEYFPGDYVPMKMVHTYQGLSIHPDIIGIKEGESTGYMFLCRIPEYKRFDIYVNDKNPDFGFYSIGPDKGIYPCEIRNVANGISIIYHHAGRFLIEWNEGFIFDGTNTYKL